MKKKISKTTRSILSFVLAAAMVMGLSGISTFAAEAVESDSTTGDEAVEVFSATEDNQTLNVIEQAADESASDVTYTFHLYQITGKTGEIETMSDITVSEAGADLSYYIIDTNTNEEIAYETTDENGSFELGADECAQFTLPAETDWYVDQDTPEAYPLIDVTADGDHASVVDSVNGVVQYDTEESEPTTVDKSALQAEYDSDLSYNEDDYTPESWEAFEDAMEHAKEVLDDPDATQEEVDEALDELEKAREGLEPAGDEPEPTPEPEPDTVEVTGEKTWDDANDQDGMRPENITVNLLADGEQTDSATVTADQDGKWTYSFTDLPEYGENGDEITYTVTEDAVANYETKIDGYDITNTYTPETMSIHGTKVWVDNEDQDGVRPDTVTVRLLANGEEADSTTASEATGWAWSFDDLAVYEDGTAIQYYVVEDTVADYTTTYDYNMTGTDDFDVTITNTHTPDETNITVLKVWSDADDQDGKRPGEVTVELLTDGVATGQTLTLSAANDWTDTFTGLPKYHDEGEAYNYSVEELSVDGYTSTRYEVTDEAYVFVNEYTPEQTAVTVNKKWDDGDNHDNARPESVAVTLFADDEAVASMSLTDAGNWAGTFTSLPAYKDHGQAIEYKVSEEEVSGYTAEVTGNAAEGFTITNTHMYTSTIDIPVTKVWEDENNNDGERPENVTVSLINKVTEEMVQTLTLSEDNKWTDSFTNVDPEAEYTVTEEEVEGYEAAIDGDQSDGFTITNTHVYGTVDVSVEKEWVDNDNEDGTRPDSVTVHLWNADTETHLGSATLNEENDWQYTFDPQPKYASGEEINYEVTEETVAGYTSDISQSTDEDGCPVFTITNTCMYEDTIDITGTKVWNDESDQDGLRPDHVTIELLADGTVVDSKDITPYTTLTFAAPSPIAAFLAAEDVNEWNFSFKDLPKYNADGSKIDYTIAELAVEDYESTVITGDMTDGFTITNTHTPATITVSGTKTWDDAGDQDGVRPSTVDVYLTIDGERVEEATGNYVTAVLNADNGWTYSFDNLDKCANGKAIEYGVEEAEVPGYEATYAAATDAGGNYTIDITNTRGTATVNYTVTKIWDDADDQDADQPTSVTVRLLANGDEVDYMNLTANEDWTGTFTDLPKYEDGQEITYTVTEDPVKDYETTYSTPMVDTEGNYSCEITNTHAPDKETLTINKVWADNGDQDGIRPESIDVNVLHVDEDTNEVVDTLTLAGDGDVWTATLDVDAYENGGQEIHYTVEEPEVPNGYEVTYGDADPLTIINTHTPETTDVTVDKVWDDNDNQDGVQHEVVTVRLYANGTEVASDNIAAVDDWTYTFTDLPKYENGEPITYTVTEDAMSDYTPAITGSVEDGFTITNTHTPGETSVSVTKAWDDGNDQDGLQPESVTVSLLADGTATDKTLELNEDNSWTGTFTSLDEYQNGSKVNYTVEEEAVTGYTTEVNGDATEGYTITNTHTPETIDVTGQKVWEDNNNQDGTRPDSIIVMLYADGAPASDKYGNSLSAIVTDENGWNFAFTGLPKYEFDEDGNGGKEIVYTIEEFAASEGYTSEVTGDVENGFTVTNTYETDTTTVSGTKTWVDNDNQDGERPDSITVHLYANGEEIDSRELTEGDAIDDNTWGYTFGGDDPLPTYKNGEKINYAVFEDEVDDYVTTYDGYDITNTHEAGLTSVTVMKLWEDNDDQDGIRPSHITVELYADGTDMGTACVLNEENDWTYTFEDLPVFDNGSRIQYAIAEIDEIDGYKVETVSVGTPVDENYYYDYVIVNEHTPATTDVEVYKQWKDDNDAEGLRPDDVTITLTGTYTEDGVTETCNTQEALIDASDNWTAVFGEIPVYHEGHAIDYTVDEVAVDGYETAISGDAENGFTVTNTLTAETGFTVSVDWVEDDAYEDEYLPTSVTVTLYADGELVLDENGDPITATLSKENEWSCDFTELPKYNEDGKEINYSVEVTAYDPEGAGSYYTPESTTDEDGNITITMHQKYFDLDEEIVPDEGDRATWEEHESVNAYNAIEIEMSTNLPDMSGEELADGEYSILFHDELASALVLDENAADFKVTIGGETISSAYYTITLADGTSPARLTPFSITINDDCSFHVEVDLSALYNDGVISDEDLQGDTELMLYFFADLEGTDLNGSFTSTAWYEVYSGDEVQYTSEQHVVEVTTYEIEITKYDASQSEEAILPGATLGVYYDGDCANPVIRNGAPYTAVSGENGIAVFYGLAEGIYYIQEMEAPIGYNLSEEVLEADLTALGEDEYVFYGEYANVPLAPVEISGTKTWDDNDDQDGMRPASVTVNLLANDEPALDASGNVITATVTADDKIDDNTWSYSFTDLPQVTDDGIAITYTVTEDTVEGYDTSIDGYDITNTHEPEMIEITGEKVWDDNDNQDGARPDFITIHLMVGDEEIAKQTITEDDDLAFDFGAQPKYADGEKIDYTVTETVPSSLPDGTYTLDIEESETDDGLYFALTNSHTPETITIQGTKVWLDSSDQDGERPDEVTVYLYAAGASGTSVSQTTVSEKTEWAWSFGELPVYDSGIAIQYSVVEEAVTDYTATYDYDMEAEGIFDVTITNTHTPGETSLTVIKFWDDEDDAAGFRPESVEVELLQDGAVYATAELSEEDNWQYTFTGLPAKHEHGTEYTYTVQEVPVSGSVYTTSDPEQVGETNAYVITNKYTPEETEVTVEKAWEDNDDQDGIRPASVTVSLLANGDVVDKATLNDADHWFKTFGELPVYADGEEITYTVEESDVPDGYETVVSDLTGDAENGYEYTITNTHTPETINISGTKVWLDNDNQDGKRPTDITINLLADGVQVDSKDVRDPDVHPARLVTPLIKILRDSAEETEDWTWSFTDLPKYANGEEIVYTVEEESVDGYETYIQGDMTTGFQIFNTHTPEQIDISVEKDWDDANDQDGLRPAYITVQLLTDEAVVDDQIVVADADGDWGCTFTVDKYADGAEIAYDVNEILPESVAEDTYTTDITGNVEDGFTITNTHEPATISITIAKEWDDADNQDGKRPKEIKVGIFAGATWVDEATLTEDEEWAPVTFSDLPAYADGEKIQYVIYEDEEGLDGYTADADITTDAETGDISCTITNSYTPEETGVMVTKVWDDGENQDGKRPETVTVNLLADGVQALDENDEPITAELSEDNDWTYNFTGLPDYEHGDEIEYSVEEVAVENYDTEIINIENANEFIIVNSYTPETINVAVNKTWVDNDDQDGTRPGYITYRLWADGEEVADWNATPDNWSYTFENVDRYADGKEIDYTVTEDPVADYTTSIDSSKDAATGNYTVSVTNTHDPEMTDMHVVKVWDDNDDQDGKRPESVTVNLLADDAVIDTAELSDESDLDVDGNWTCTFTDLPVYENGEEIDYDVEEIDVPDGYDYTIQKDADEDGHLICAIVNTHEPETIAIAGEKVWDDEENQDGVRPDYIIVHLWADEEEIANQTITDSDEDWTFDFGELPVYADGDEITYTLTETLPASADGVYEEPVITSEETEDGIYFTVTNTHVPETVTIQGTKVWDDGGDQDGERLESVPILLLADGQIAATTTVGTEDAIDDDTWAWSFGEVPVYGDGVAIQYYVVEGTVPDYSATYEYDMEAEGIFDVTITNTHTPDTTNLTVIKYWDDKNNESGFRPESIEIELLRANVETPDDTTVVETVALNDDNNWTYTFTDLPEKHDSGVEYTYSVAEITEISDVYESTGPTLVEGTDSTYVFTNTYVPEETEVVVEKKWDDDNDRDRYRPESITATLLVNGEYDKEATLSEANNWAYDFAELPVMVNGEEATYTVEEVAVDNYDTEITYEETTNVDGLPITEVTITNTYEPETVDIEGIKIWVDNDDQDGIRPDEVTVNILADGEPALDEDGEPITVTISDATIWNPLFAPLVRTFAGETENRWEWSLNGVLPKYDGWEDDGETRHEIEYTIEEAEVDGYETYIEGDMYNGFEIYNIHETDKVEVTGTKTWVDDNNSEDLRPAYIVINLYAGDDDEAIAHQTITEQDNWTFDFTDLDKKADGEDIVYTITESMPEDAAAVYTTSIKQVDEDGYVYEITNTLSAATSLTVTVDWDDGENAAETRPDSIGVTLYANGDPVELSDIANPVTLNAEGEWTYTWEDLPVYDENGKRIEYTIGYEDIEGYDTETTYDEETDTFTIECTLIRSVDIYKYTEGNDNIAVRIDEDDPDANMDDEAFCFTATESGAYYVCYEVAGSSSYYPLRNTDFSVDDTVGNLYYVSSFDRALNMSSIAEITVVAGEDYFIHRSNATLESEYTGPHLCLVAESNITNVNDPVSAEHVVDMAVGYYEIEKVKIPLAEAQFVLTNEDGEYGIFDEDGIFVEWTEDYDDATILTSGEDGYIHLTGLAVGEYSLIEIEAPDTYEPLDEPIEITIGDADVTVEVDVENEPATTDVHVNKEWDDNDNQDGMRTDSVTVNLVKGEDEDAEVVATAELSEANDWAYTFEGIPAYEDGEEIDYTVEEAEVPDGYELTAIEKDADEDGHLVCTIVNTHEPITFNVTVNKEWDDADDQDGKRPDEITVGIFAGETAIAHDIELSEENDWSYTFEDLDAYADGEEIPYIVYEDEVENYSDTWESESDADGNIICTVTNSYTPSTTSVTVTKVWDDADNQDGVRPEEITVNLLADEEPALGDNDDPITATLSEENETGLNTWSYTFTDLPEYKDGQKIDYTVTEDIEEIEEDYDTEIIPIENSNEFIIVNSHTPETVDITVNKTWDDNDNQDGKRPAYITYRLWADGEEVGSWNAVADDDWSYTFEGFDKYANGEEIVYTVTEDAVDGYETSYEPEDGAVGEDGIVTITNTHKPETVAIHGTKAWEDSDNQDGVRPNEEGITISLLKAGDSGLDTVENIILTEEENVSAENANEWVWSFADEYPVYENGTAIQYYIVEGEVKDYTAEYTYEKDAEVSEGSDADSSYNVTITNTHAPDMTSITVIKNWVDENDADGIRPTALTINLLRTDAETPEDTTVVDTLTLNEANNWQGTFTELPKYHDSGVAYVYTVQEDLAEDSGYEPGEPTQVDDTQTYVITNTHEPESVDIEGVKTWDDNDNQDGKRPAYITIRLLADEEEIASTHVTAEEYWSWSFTDLPKYDNGVEIEYTITEDPVAGYTTEVDGYDVTNSYTPETVDVTGSKTWDDKDNQDGKRPESITISLLADGNETASQTVTAADGWSWSFTDLPKYKAGVEITYTIAEDEVAGYETTINGYDVTNSYEPSKTSLNVQKIWADADDQDGVRPNDITVKLTKNGTATGDELTLDESSGWAGSFTDLDEYTDGVINEYSISEVSVDGYTTEVETVEGTSTIVITNEYEPETIDIPVTKVWEDEDNQDGSRPDEITFRVWNGNTMVDSATIEPEADGSWPTYTFEGLAKYESGEEIAYVVTEDSVDNYSTEVTGSTEEGFTVTNSHTPEQTSISVFKVWDDNGDQDDTRPESITVKLLADGDETDNTLTLDEGNSWMGSFTVDKYEGGGTEVVYTVAEDQVDGYSEPVITGDASIGYIITNTLDTVKLHGTVIWVDDSDAYDVRPDEVTLAVYADGKPALDENDDPITVKVDETTTYSLFRPLVKTLAADTNEWQWSISGLPKYNSDGTEIEYTVVEDAFDNSAKYETYVQGDAENGFEVFNVYTLNPTIILTLYDSTDHDITLAGTGVFTLYRVVEDGYDEVVQADLRTDENGQIIVSGLADGSYYFVQTDIDNDDYTLSANPTSETVTIPDDLDENYECEVTMEDDPVYVVDYAVKIWGIGADTYSYDDGETLQTAGLTFGPATGADYTNSYVSRETVGEAAHPSEYCIHDMTWTEIIEQSKTDPKVFEDCKTNGCTKAVKLTPNDTLFNSDAVTATVNQHFTGDGVGTLHYELVTGSPTYALRWNYGTVTGTGEEELTYSNVYSRSRIRTMLTGDRTNIDNAVSEGSSSSIYYTTSSPLADSGNCLLSCFPDALQDAIVPRVTSNQGTGPYIHDNAAANDIETYDTLWLFSLTELGLSDNYNDSGGIDYEMISANSERVAYGLSDVNASGASAQAWWTRARYASGYTIAYDINNAGAASHNNSVANSVDGISPCFCLPGPDEEAEGYTGTARYAVKLWGICADTYSEDDGSTSGTASLTFGPALGASYLESSVSCDSDTCIHKLEWAEIIAYCDQYQGNKTQLEELFGSCLENGCTKDVELTTNSTLFSSEAVQNAMDQGYYGDGVSTLSYLLKTENSAQTGLFWNLADTGSSTSNPSNVYTHSRVRTSLNGDSANIMAQIAAGHTNFYYNDSYPLLTENNCLFSCFPEELQSAIVPRKVNTSWTEIHSGESTNYEETTYDNLWLLSDVELGLTGTSDDGTDYGIVTSDADRVAYEYSSADATSAAAQDWWTRSRSDSTQYDEHIVYKIQSDGTSTDSEPNAGNGISPAFCLK